MTDINKLIEEEKKLNIKDRWSYYNYSDDPTYAYREGYESGIDKGVEIVLHQNRWRKVEEELPEDNSRVLIKSKAGRVYLSCYTKQSGFSSGANIAEWKHII